MSHRRPAYGNLEQKQPDFRHLTYMNDVHPAPQKTKKTLRGFGLIPVPAQG